MRTTSLVVFLFSSLLLFSEKVSSQISKNGIYQKGDSLKNYYPFDSIYSITLHNFKGSHILSKDKVISLIPFLKNYTFNGTYAKTKPGHIWGTITFLNGNKLSFYSNSTAEIIITKNGHKTFVTNATINLDNY